MNDKKDAEENSQLAYLIKNLKNEIENENKIALISFERNSKYDKI